MDDGDLRCRPKDSLSKIRDSVVVVPREAGQGK